jgi:hypothetical protein
MPTLITIVTTDDDMDNDAYYQVRVLNNFQLESHINELPSTGILSIEIRYFSEVNQTNALGPLTLVVPDLTRFQDLEMVTIDFPGEVVADTESNQLTLPNRVWMFALRNAQLNSMLRFGFRDTLAPLIVAVKISLTMRIGLPSSITDIICSFWGEAGLYDHPNPHAVIALQNASLLEEVGWQTKRGHNQEDMSLMIWTNKNSCLGPTNIEDRLIECRIRELNVPYYQFLSEDQDPEDYFVSTFVDPRGSEGDNAVCYEAYQRYRKDFEFESMLYNDYTYRRNLMEWILDNLILYTNSLGSAFDPYEELCMFLNGVYQYDRRLDG